MNQSTDTMPAQAYSLRYVARVTIQFATGFHVGAGPGEVSDAEVVTDANGLPAIPGSSLAGVLRAAFPVEAAKRLFGYQGRRKKGQDHAEGQGSQLRVSWACIHAADNQPVEGLVDETLLIKDLVLVNARHPSLREHVSITPQGVANADERGLFTEHVVCAGHRFTFEIEMVASASDEDRETWARLLSILQAGDLRLGGKSRRGLGAFTVQQLRCWTFDLTRSRELNAYADFPVSFANTSLPKDEPLPALKAGSDSITATLTLTPCGYWMFGGGSDIDGQEGEADMAPVRDKRIEWPNDKGEVVDNLVLRPAASIKGALAHRLAFHYNVLAGNFADKGANPMHCTGGNNKAVAMLLGYVSTETKEARRGNVLIDDMLLAKEDAPSQQLLHHVAIDRFTGGVMPSVLFAERPFWQGAEFKLALTVTAPSAIIKGDPDGNIRLALQQTLLDLTSGKLQVGAGSGRGMGYFKGSVEWSDKAAWLTPGNTTTEAVCTSK